MVIRAKCCGHTRVRQIKTSKRVCFLFYQLSKENARCTQIDAETEIWRYMQSKSPCDYDTRTTCRYIEVYLSDVRRYLQSVNRNGLVHFEMYSDRVLAERGSLSCT